MHLQKFTVRQQRAAPIHRPAARIVTRSSVQEPSTSSNESGQVASTLANLDALLGPTAAAKPSPPSSASSSTATNNTPAAAPAPAPPRAPQPPPAAARKAPLSFEQVMGFSGVAPEIINGRAAMIGFVAALSAELGRGESVYGQLVSGGAGKAALVILAVTVASFAPAIRQLPWDQVFGRGKTPPEFGPFNAYAELINGRAAMLGLGVILFLEGAGNTAFFL